MEIAGKPGLCPHCCLPRPLLQSAAVAERERVSQMFAEATATLQSFQTEVLGFIEEGEATMLGRSQGDLRRQEEQRSRLSQARHNLSQVPEADSVSFLQVRAAWEPQRELRGWGGVEKWVPGCLAFHNSCYLPWLGDAVASRLTGHLSDAGAPGTTTGPGGGVRPWAWAPQGTQLHQVLPSGQSSERHPCLSLCQPLGAAAGAGR